MSLRTRDAAVLQASEACCRLYVERATTDLTIAEIAAEVGLSERTFYRYFPTKAQTVKPVFDWTTATFNETVLTTSPANLALALREGFRAMLGGAVTGRTRGLFPLVFGDPEMWSVFLRAVHEGEVSLRPVLATRTGHRPDSVEVFATAAGVAAATKVALESMVTRDQDPEATFLAVLASLGAGKLLSH